MAVVVADLRHREHCVVKVRIDRSKPIGIECGRHQALGHSSSTAGSCSADDDAGAIRPPPRTDLVERAGRLAAGIALAGVHLVPTNLQIWHRRRSVWMPEGPISTIVTNHVGRLSPARP